jgi:hypothetical protein
MTTAILTETARRPSALCTVPGALDIEIDIAIGDRTGHVGITLAPQQYDARRMGPIGDTMDAWISSPAMLRALPEAACDALVRELSCWLDGSARRSEIDIDLSGDE